MDEATLTPFLKFISGSYITRLMLLAYSVTSVTKRNPYLKPSDL